MKTKLAILVTAVLLLFGFASTAEAGRRCGGYYGGHGHGGVSFGFSVGFRPSCYPAYGHGYGGYPRYRIYNPGYCAPVRVYRPCAPVYAYRPCYPRYYRASYGYGCAPRYARCR